ncbi:MAG TPA: F0F1 ATP synthase subunit A [Alphaproteobacteria bacterium]|nr:F0F1 ATP synthase subunit A [Alphaproteobacteria bacterium]
MAGEAGHQGPLDQFRIERYVEIDLGGFDASFTNSAALMTAAVIITTALMVFGMRPRALIPGRLQSIAELSYEMIANMLGETLGPEGRRYFPWIFSLFMFLLLGNTLGLIPYSFTFTSHIAVTFILAAVVFVAVIVIGLIRHRLKFFSLFLPPDVPLWLSPLLVPIEIVSFLARPISLSVRLFANMMAGHTMMHVFAGFVFSLGFLGFAPLAFIVALFGLETIIAVLQAYVFTILTCLYLKDAIHLSH